MTEESKSEQKSKEPILGFFGEAIGGIGMLLLGGVLCGTACGIIWGANKIVTIEKNRESIREANYKGYPIKRGIIYGVIFHEKYMRIYDRDNYDTFIDVRGEIIEHKERWINIDLSNVPRGNALENVVNLTDIEGAWNSATNKPLPR